VSDFLLRHAGEPKSDLVNPCTVLIGAKSGIAGMGIFTGFCFA
jgi:hypothetical protein